jgi:hypothetical protein
VLIAPVVEARRKPAHQADILARRPTNGTNDLQL